MNKAPNDLADAVVAEAGGAGFIGSHLVVRLLKADVETVRIIDSFEYGDLHNLDFPAANVQVTSLRLGAGTRQELVGHLDGVDFLFRVAAEKHNQCVDNPLIVIDANIAGTHELLPDDIGTLEDLEQFSLLDKRTVREHIHFDLLSDNHGKSHLLPISTSGASGEPYVN